MTEIKTLIAHTRPAEIYYDRFKIPISLLNYLKNITIQKHTIHISEEHKLLCKNAFPELVRAQKSEFAALTLLIAHLQKSL